MSASSERATTPNGTSTTPATSEAEEMEVGGREERRGVGTVARGASRASRRRKGTWTLRDDQEEEVVEWLQANDFLWLRSSRDYHKKKAAWEEKARSLGVSLQHLEKWWKNTKDWYVKIRKSKSGQAARQYTERDRWLLKNLAFYTRK